MKKEKSGVEPSNFDFFYTAQAEQPLKTAQFTWVRVPLMFI